MSVRTAQATWKGTLKEGKGHLNLESGVYKGPYTWASRFAGGKETNPEELIGAAHAGCYAMFLSALLTGNNTPPEQIQATARVHLEKGPTITKIELQVEAKVPGITKTKFSQLAKEAKEKCPVSKALAAVPKIVLKAVLV